MKLETKLRKRIDELKRTRNETLKTLGKIQAHLERMETQFQKLFNNGDKNHD